MPDFKHKAREDLAFTLKIHIWTDSSVSYYVKSGESKVCFGNEVAHRAQTGKVRKTMKAERRDVDFQRGWNMFKMREMTWNGRPFFVFSISGRECCRYFSSVPLSITCPSWHI